MKEFFKEIFLQGNKGVEKAIPIKDSIVETQTKTSLADRYNNWWERENAKAFLRQYPVYGVRIFPVGQTSFYEVCFGAVLDKFFFSHGKWRHVQKTESYSSYPEICVSFVCADVYGLKDTWNRRDLNLREIILMELQRALLQYTRSRGIDISRCSDRCVSGLWMIGNTLIMELPDSAFACCHPELVGILASDDYKERKKLFDLHNRL
ncbi:hypothetical protein [Faecalimonas umbilicata]|uniref:hypothetical protein n=1 Tax=Faecalimonas umbilicata TaxID=1912855 RepID=UPI000E416019|nr:hypothetical protein [Faecalimonas umbilicata]RGC78111.1 hypothetical protein DW669_08070 [Lachnospiraceae bacterium AM25-17]RJU61945.1 hypothetical protein DW709_15955 [Coprococcus sp. AM27-12LB]